MKHSLVSLFTGALLLAAPIAYADGDQQPRHGGIVTEVKEVQYELVAKTDTLQIHVSDHGKPLKVDGGSARVTLLAGTEKQEVELKPAGDKLEAKGNFKVAAGTKVAAVINLAGKAAANARFTLK